MTEYKENLNRSARRQESLRKMKKERKEAKKQLKNTPNGDRFNSKKTRKVLPQLKKTNIVVTTSSIENPSMIVNQKALKSDTTPEILVPKENYQKEQEEEKENTDSLIQTKEEEEDGMPMKEEEEEEDSVPMKEEKDNVFIKEEEEDDRVLIKEEAIVIKVETVLHTEEFKDNNEEEKESNRELHENEEDISQSDISTRDKTIQENIPTPSVTTATTLSERSTLPSTHKKPNLISKLFNKYKEKKSSTPSVSTDKKKTKSWKVWRKVRD